MLHMPPPGSSTSPANLVLAFAHATLFSPVLSTLEEALNHDHVPKFVGLMLQMLQKKHLPQSTTTIKWSNTWTRHA